jgi:TrmH family RNA methyltransferase
VISISSEQNEHFKRWRGLDSSKGIRKAGEFVLMGEKLIDEYLASATATDGAFARFTLRAELGPEGYVPRTRAWREQLRHPICSLPPKLFETLDVVGTKAPLIVLALPDLERFEPGTPPRGLELVCPVGDPGNLGAVVRSAAAFGASRMILTEEASLPFHPKALKGSAGAALAMRFAKGPALRAWTPASGEWALDMDGESLDSFRAPADLRLVLGEEGPGLPAGHAWPRLSIPTQAVESLNVAVAAGIALYRLSRRS